MQSKKINIFKDKELLISTIVIIVFLLAFTAYFIFKKNNLIEGAYVSIGLFFVSTVYTLIRPLILKRKILWFEWLEIIFDVLFVIILIIFFLVSIEEPIRTIATAVSSAFLGGFFTLYGVGLTIKYNRLSKQEDELHKAVPHIFPISPSTLANMNNHDMRLISTKMWKTNLKKAKESEKAYTIWSFYISNSDISMCVYHGIVVNGEALYFDYGQVLQRGANSQIVHNIRFKMKGEINSFELILTDMLDNEYRVRADFNIRKQGKDKIIDIYGLFQPVLYKNK